MSVKNITFSLSCALGGAYLMQRGLRNCYNGHTGSGKYQVALGAIAIVGGVYSLMNLNQQPISMIIDPASEEIRKACENVLTKGEHLRIPAFNPIEHIKDIHVDVSNSPSRYSSCGITLTSEGYAVLNRFKAEKGLALWAKSLFSAFRPNGGQITGVIS